MPDYFNLITHLLMTGSGSVMVRGLTTVPKWNKANWIYLYHDVTPLFT